MTRLRISPPLAVPAAYDVVVQSGGLAELPALVGEAAGAHRYVVVSDANVAPLWGEPVLAALRGAGLRADPVVVPAGANHNVINTGGVSLKLYTLYAPPNHRDGVVHHTPQDAQADTEHFDGKTTE